MEAEDLRERVAALEAKVATLTARLAAAEGEVIFAGQVAPLALMTLIAAGLLPRESAREALDRLQLRLEEGQASGVLSSETARHAWSRVEATLQPWLGSLPGRH